MGTLRVSITNDLFWVFFSYIQWQDELVQHLYVMPNVQLFYGIFHRSEYISIKARNNRYQHHSGCMSEIYSEMENYLKNKIEIYCRRWNNYVWNESVCYTDVYLLWRNRQYFNGERNFFRISLLQYGTSSILVIKENCGKYQQLLFMTWLSGCTYTSLPWKNWKFHLSSYFDGIDWKPMRRKSFSSLFIAKLPRPSFDCQELCREIEADLNLRCKI